MYGNVQKYGKELKIKIRWYIPPYRMVNIYKRSALFEYCGGADSDILRNVGKCSNRHSFMFRNTKHHNFRQPLPACMG
jgi:hypothetical protein